MLTIRNGFTLVEILVALLVSSFVVTAVYRTFDSMLQSYVTQTEIAAMQQNLRAAMEMMADDLRTVGYDPGGSAAAGFVAAVSAEAARIEFTRDLNSDGDTDDSSENITYSLYETDGIRKLGRKNPSLNRPVAMYIDALDFIFLDRDSHETTVLRDIQAVQITLVARTSKAEKGYRDNQVFRNPNNKIIFGPASDGFRRCACSVTVACRNMGL